MVKENNLGHWCLFKGKLERIKPGLRYCDGLIKFDMSVIIEDGVINSERFIGYYSDKSISFLLPIAYLEVKFYKLRGKFWELIARVLDNQMVYFRMFEHFQCFHADIIRIDPSSTRLATLEFRRTFFNSLNRTGERIKYHR